MQTYDCSHPLDSGMPVYPGDDTVRVSEFRTVPADGSCMRELELNTHVGTHVDAPSHKVADGRTLSDLPLDRFRFAARLVTCRPCNDRERLTMECLPADLRANPDSVPGDTDTASESRLLAFDTGWGEHWGTERYRDSPYLEPDLAAWCATHDFHVGIDAFSPDPVPSAEPGRESEDEPTDQPAHAALCGADRLIVENLRGLDRLPEQFELLAYPLAIRNGDGSPVRAVARVRDR